MNSHGHHPIDRVWLALTLAALLAGSGSAAASPPATPAPSPASAKAPTQPAPPPPRAPRYDQPPQYMLDVLHAPAPP